MTKDAREDMQKMINASGFLLQLAIEDLVKQTVSKHGWRVASREHPWSNPESGSEGFIDLILRSEYDGRLVIECKRSLDAIWVFLVPKLSFEKKTRTRSLWSDLVPGKRWLLGWYDFDIKPESYESGFCVIRGQGEGDKSMLERLSDILLKSVECLAAEEAGIAQKQPIEGRFFYHPVVVTTAQLHVCRFKYEDVSVNDGKLPTAEFESVPFLRFRKSLTTNISSDSRARDISEANLERERTILIVNSSHLIDFLTKWEIAKRKPFEKYPWEIAREIERSKV